MASFEDTKLLRHPTVERAYNEMRKFFVDGEDFAAEACRAGELITAHAKNPDPDAIAASVLLDGMVVPYQAPSFASSVSPRAAEILENMYNFNPDAPEFPGPAEQQIVLAHSIIGLEGVSAKIRAGEVYSGMSYNDVKRALDANEKVLLKVIDNAAESGMAVAAVEQLLITKAAMDDFVRKTQAALAFDKSGLPDHPLVRGVYEYMKDANFAMHPLGGYVDTNAGIARVIVETGASTDPEVICAALLNQYSTLHDKKAPAEFSPRIGALWAETSAWAGMGAGDHEKVPPTPEGGMIRHAAHLYFAEGTVEGFSKMGRKRMSVHDLEYLEDAKDRVVEGLKTEDHPGLKARMEAAVAACDAIMNRPANLKTRKPGSPRLDRDW